MIREVKLNTLHMYDNFDHNDKNYTLWQKIAEYIHGETAIILEKTFVSDNDCLFLGLKDEVKNKELHYMMEQDSEIGAYIGDRAGFDKAWDSGKYEHDCCWYLEKQYLVFN